MRLPLAAALLCVAIVPPAVAAPDCEGLARREIFGVMRMLKAQPMPRDPAATLPAYCEVEALLHPGPVSRIVMVARLPEDWNGKMLGLGGGGWAGDITLERATPGLRLGYATVQTDAGHASTDLADTSFQVNPEALIDFAWRAIHQSALAGKSLVERYYARPADHSYFLGCSTGGRQGMVEAQRFPSDYDGIVAGAPVYTFVTQTTMLLHNQAFAGAAIDDQELAWANSRMLAACDADDGLVDGVVTDPRRCKLDLATLRCAGLPRGALHCLTAPQAAALERVYATVRNRQGQIAAYPLMRGSEAGWARFVTTTPVAPEAPTTLGNTAGGLATLRAVLLGDPFFDLSRFDPERDLPRLRRSAFARMYEADNPDLSAFLGRGGKLLLWHGIDDPGPSPWATVDYYQAARRVAARGKLDFDGAVRLYLAPGVRHCAGGPGADDFDLITAVDGWASSGKPPDITAHNQARGITRPLCAYPALPRYRSGDANSASSFDCIAPPSGRDGS